MSSSFFGSLSQLVRATAYRRGLGALSINMKPISPLTSSCAVHQIDLITKHSHYQLLVDVKQAHLEEK